MRAARLCATRPTWRSLRAAAATSCTQLHGSNAGLMPVGSSAPSTAIILGMWRTDNTKRVGVGVAYRGRRGYQFPGHGPTIAMLIADKEGRSLCVTYCTD